jgi:hypothetical protein
MAVFVPVHPPRNPEECAPWLYEALIRLNRHAGQSSASLAAVGRGETPDGSGNPLPVTPDLSGYFLLAGRLNGQIARGGTAAADPLVLSSTANSTKGKIYLGLLGQTYRSALDEAQGLLGINTTSPAATLHIVGSGSGAGSTILCTSIIDDRWGAERSGAGGSGTGFDSLHALVTNDDSSGYIAANVGGGVPVGTNPHKMGLGGVITPGATYSILSRVAPFSNNTDRTLSSYMVSLVDSAGNQWDSAVTFTPADAGLSAAELSATALTWADVARSVVCSGTPVSTGNTPNAIWISADFRNNVNAGLFTCVTYIAVSQAGSALARWDLATATRSGQIDIAGHLGVGTGATDLDAAITGVPDLATTLGLRIKAAASQTADLVRLTDSAGTALAGATAAGAPYLVAGAATDALLVSDASGVGAWKQQLVYEDESVFYDDSPVYL